MGKLTVKGWGVRLESGSIMFEGTEPYFRRERRFAWAEADYEGGARVVQITRVYEWPDKEGKDEG